MIEFNWLECGYRYIIGDGPFDSMMATWVSTAY